MTLQRIEAALVRLEAAAAQPRRAPPTDAGADTQLAPFQASNARLREAVGQALRQIDGLIGAHSAETGA